MDTNQEFSKITDDINKKWEDIKEIKDWNIVKKMSYVLGIPLDDIKNLINIKN